MNTFSNAGAEQINDEEVAAANRELDRLTIKTDARHGERIMSRVFDFLGRFVAYPSEHAHVAHAL